MNVDIHAKNENGKTALMRATEGNYQEVVKYLLENGAK